MNSETARTPTGEIIDQQAQVPTENPPETSAGETKPDDTAPITETYTFTAPEGVEIDPTLIAEATPIFKELGLDQAKAQKLVDLYNKQTGGIQKTLTDAIEATRTAWRAEVKSDPVIGGKLESAVLPEIGRAFDKLPPDVSKALRADLDFTGAGDKLGVVRALYEMSKLINEGTHVSGSAPSPHGQVPAGKVTPPSAAKALYPNLA
jgi:hypothetical protein